MKKLFSIIAITVSLASPLVSFADFRYCNKDSADRAKGTNLQITVQGFADFFGCNIGDHCLLSHNESSGKFSVSLEPACDIGLMQPIDNVTFICIDKNCFLY